MYSSSELLLFGFPWLSREASTCCLGKVPGSVGTLPAVPSAAAPGAGRGDSRLLPSGFPTAAALERGPLSSAFVLPPVFSICDGNRCGVTVSLPGGFPVAAGVEISVCRSPPSRPSVSARAGVGAAVQFCPRAIVPFLSFTIFSGPILLLCQCRLVLGKDLLCCCVCPGCGVRCRVRSRGHMRRIRRGRRHLDLSDGRRESDRLSLSLSKRSAEAGAGSVAS
jgi:hypothetical protein